MSEQSSLKEAMIIITDIIKIEVMVLTLGVVYK